MKYSTAMLSLAAVATAQPAFTNLAFDVVENQPFTLTFDGCEGGCTIILSNGPSGDLQEVQELTSSATGGEFTFTPESIPSDQYAFEIINNETGENNYSEQFQYEGQGEEEEDDDASSTTVIATTFTSATTATLPVTETTSPEVTTVTTSATTMMTTMSSASEASTTTSEDEATTTAGETTSPTTIPDGAGAAIGSPLTLVVAAVAGLIMFN